MTFEWRSKKVMEGILWVAEGREFQKEVLTSDKALRQEQACQSKDKTGIFR